MTYINKDREALAAVLKTARELNAKAKLTKTESDQLDAAIEMGKRLAKRIEGLQTMEKFESESFGTRPSDTVEDEDGFAPGLGAITGGSLKAVWNAASKAGGIPSGNDFKVPGVGYKEIVSGGGLLAAPVRDLEDYTLPMKPSLITNIAPSKLIGSNDFTYIVQTVRSNQAAVVPDGETKPTSVYTFAERSGKLETIAHMSEPIANRILQDKSGLASFLYAEMAQGLALAAEAELVDTVLADLAVQSQAFVTDAFVTFRKAVTKLQAKYMRADFLAISLVDAEALDLERYTFDGHFVFDGPRSAGPDGPVWSVPLIINDALPVGTAVMGNAAQSLRRYVNGVADFAVDTLSGFDVNTTRTRLEQRSKSVVVRPFGLVVIDTGNGS